MHVKLKDDFGMVLHGELVRLRGFETLLENGRLRAGVYSGAFEDTDFSDFELFVGRALFVYPNADEDVLHVDVVDRDVDLLIVNPLLKAVVVVWHIPRPRVRRVLAIADAIIFALVWTENRPNAGYAFNRAKVDVEVVHRANVPSTVVAPSTDWSNCILISVNYRSFLS